MRVGSTPGILAPTVSEALRQLFSPEIFMPAGHCYLWRPGLIWLELVSSAVIGLAGLAMTVALGLLVWRVPELPRRRTAIGLLLYTLACGLCFLFDGWVIWSPRYWAHGALRAIAAVTALGAAIVLPGLGRAAAASSSRRRAGVAGRPFEPAPTFDLSEAIASVIEQLRPRAARRGLDLRFARPAGLPPASSDPRAVRRIVTDMIGDAIEVAAGGAIEIAVAHESAGHRISVRGAGAGNLFAVILPPAPAAAT